MSRVALLVAIGADGLQPVVDLAAALPPDHQPVVVTTSTDWAPLRQAGLQWEHLVAAEAWERLEHDRPWIDYAAKRLRSLVASWSPSSVLQLGADPVHAELARALLPPAVTRPSSPPAPVQESARLRSRLERLEKRQQQLAKEQERRALGDAVDALLDRALPAGERVAVISRGDPLLARRKGASHFPQDDGGGWAGFYPGDGEEAVGQVVALRSRGIRYLLVPPPAGWWLDHYPALAGHLDRACDVVTAGDAGTLFCLEPVGSR